MKEHLEYGPILCIDGPHKGRIGYLDNFDVDCTTCKNDCLLDEDDDTEPLCEELAVIYWGDILACTTYELIPPEHCSNTIPMEALINRINILESQTARMNETKKKALLLQELSYAQILFYEKHIHSETTKTTGHKLFISHSSKDKAWANCLFADLVEHGHTPWLDDRNIKAGESIPKEILSALESSDYLLLILTPDSVNSSWVSTEWQTLFWNEINKQKTIIIPLLLSDCEIPLFLATKKYIDFRENYQQGLITLLKAIS